MKPIVVIQGIAMPGKRIGRTLGVPTANLPLPDSRPQNGVYVARVLLPDDNNRAEEAVLSQGFHPTVPEGAPTVEVFLLNRQEDLYDRPITVEYLHYIRPEMTFPSREAMRQQMLQDIQFSRDWFREHAGSEK